MKFIEIFIKFTVKRKQSESSRALSKFILKKKTDRTEVEGKISK